MRRVPLVLGMTLLGAAWLGPLPALSRQAFSAHMAMHMLVVAIAAPLVALGIAGSALDPVRSRPRLFAPLPASFIELAVVWAWHLPVLHHAARHTTSALLLEQASFLGAGLLLWLAAAGGDPSERRARCGTGIVAMLLTSMHMTLLGALFALARRPLYHDASGALAGASALADQQMGGVIMLALGGASYLAGGLWLTVHLVRSVPFDVRPGLAGLR